VIHKNLSIEEQASEVDRVKRSESGMIVDPITLSSSHRIYEALELMKKYRISGVPITDDGSKEGRLVGILTNRDLRFETKLDRPIGDIMTREDLITVPVGTTLDAAREILHQHKVEKLLVVDHDYRLKGLITVKDIQKAVKYPNASKDSLGRLRCGAAIGVAKDTMERAEALVAAGVDVNQVSPADLTSPLLMATINGHFDLAKYLLDRGADPNLASDAGATPLYAALNVQWAPKAFYPQPRAYLQQKLSYLELMTALLDKGADPNARLQRKIWYSSYNFDVLRVDEGGASAFWRAAYASDIDAMKMLVARGADPHMPTTKPAGRPTRGDAGQVVVIEDRSGLPPVPVGGPGVSPLQAAAGVGYGEGFAGNAHRFAPSGMLAAVKYLVEELGADVNAIDHDGNTALHHAAARGDVEMILYLVSKGADPTVINREGNSTADMANGPVQRTQPYPDARDLLVKLGAINQGKCVSC
jgi:CBS domain-containing protein